MLSFKPIKFFLAAMLCMISLHGYSQTESKSMAQQQLITNAMQYINKIWNNSNATSRMLTEKYFTPDTTLVINGKPVYNGYDELESHFQEAGKTIHGNFQFPFFEMISVNNKIITRFDEDIIDHQGAHYPANVIAIFTLKNGKIQRWEEVANTKYFCQAESAKIVFSK